MRFDLFINLRGCLVSSSEWNLLFISFGTAGRKKVVAQGIACRGGLFVCLGFIVHTHVGNSQGLFVWDFLAKLALVWLGDLLMAGWLIWYDVLLGVVGLMVLVPAKALRLVEIHHRYGCWNVLVSSKGWTITNRVYRLLQNRPLHLLSAHSHVHIHLPFRTLNFAAIILSLGFLIKVPEARPLAFPVLSWRGGGRDLKSLKCADEACVKNLLKAEHGCWVVTDVLGTHLVLGTRCSFLILVAEAWPTFLAWWALTKCCCRCCQLSCIDANTRRDKLIPLGGRDQSSLVQIWTVLRVG